MKKVILAVLMTLSLNVSADMKIKRTDFSQFDVNMDGSVDRDDFNLFRQAFGTSDPTYDFDGDGMVGFSDYGLMRNAINIDEVTIRCPKTK